MDMKLKDVMNEQLLSSRFGSIDSSYLTQLWMRVVEGVNAFLQANNSAVYWDCERVDIPFSDLEHQATLMSILSEKEHPTEGHDYLFLIINELVLRYNNFVSLNSTNQNCQLHPRTLVRASKGSHIVSGVFGVQSVIANLIESYWIISDGNFNAEGLTNAIRQDVGLIGGLEPIRSPLSFLRQTFAFREISLESEPGGGSPDECFCSADGLYFSRNEEFCLYEEVTKSAKSHGFTLETTVTKQIRQTMFLAFHTFSHDQWTCLLEGLRNTLGHFLQSNFSCREGNFLQVAGLSTLQAAGFPQMDDTQASFLNTITANDLMAVIFVCGEQLASEAYRFSNLPSRLAEPLTNEAKLSIHEGLGRLLKSKEVKVVIAEIDDFCNDVLVFYCDRLLVPASETANEGLAVFLSRNNCCDELDGIFKAIPQTVSTRSYIDLQKALYQTKLELLSKSTSQSLVHPTQESKSERIPSKWKWLAIGQIQDEATEDAAEKYRWKAFGNLWFEKALMMSSIDQQALDQKKSEVDGCEEKKEERIDLTEDLVEHDFTHEAQCATNEAQTNVYATAMYVNEGAVQEDRPEEVIKHDAAATDINTHQERAVKWYFAVTETLCLRSVLILVLLTMALVSIKRNSCINCLYKINGYEHEHENDEDL